MNTLTTKQTEFLDDGSAHDMEARKAYLKWAHPDYVSDDDFNDRYRGEFNTLGEFTKSLYEEKAEVAVAHLAIDWEWSATTSGVTY